MKKSVQLALSKLGDGPLLDYGCGSGFFISEILRGQFKNPCEGLLTF
jgi:hypothetical protein